jgi:hypothetical protein
LSKNNKKVITGFIHSLFKKNRGVTKTSNIGRDKWDLFDVTVILEVASLHRDELELESALFNDDRGKNNFFELIVF